MRTGRALTLAAVAGLGLALLALSTFHLTTIGTCGSGSYKYGSQVAAPCPSNTGAWIGALAGAAYVAWFGVGSLFGKRGGGRSVALVLDAVLGSTSTVAALPWPRAHVRSLLGGELAHGLPQWKSTAVLYVLTAVQLALCAVRFPR